MKRTFSLIFFTAFLSIFPMVSLAQGQSSEQTICTAFQRNTYNAFATACAGTEGSQICYGYDSIVAFEDETTPIENFDVGDKLPLENVEALTSEAYDATMNQWGLALLQLPDIQVTPTETVSNLRYILFGGVELTDTDEPDTDYDPFQSFTFATAQDDDCVSTPSALFIQSTCIAGDTTVRQFRAEGIDIIIDGAAVLLGGEDAGFIQIVVIYGVVTIQPDVYTDEITEPTDQTRAIVVPVGYTITAPLDPDEPIDSEDHVGAWSPIRELTREELADLEYIENLPSNISYCPVSIPTIRLTSGAGGTVPRLRFPTRNPLLPVIPFCQVANPPAFCAYLGLP